MIARWTGRIVAIAIVVAIVGAAVFWWNRPKPAPAATAPPTPQVGVVEVKAADVALPLDFSGRVAGFRVVEISQPLFPIGMNTPMSIQGSSTAQGL
jgi:membrane fusion protein (multidrug efflux system)